MTPTLAGRFINAVKQIPGATRFAQAGGKDIVKGSIPGAVATSVMSTVTTGNPLAGALVGATDLATSSLLARGLGSRKLNEALLGAKDKYPIAGSLAKRLQGRTLIDKDTGKEMYQLSTAQGIATALGSIGSAVTLEPYFYPREEAVILAQQYPHLLNQQLQEG